MPAGKLWLVPKRRIKRKRKKPTLKSRVKKLEKRANRKTEFTEVDDADVFLTPLVGKIMMMNGGAGEGYLLGINLRGVIEQKNDLPDSVLTRIVIVRDKHNSDPDNDTPLWLDVFKENEIFSHRAITTHTAEDEKRFTVVYDHVFKTTRDLDGTIDSKVFFEYRKNYKRMYISMDGTASKSVDNGLYLMMMSTGVTTDIDVSYSFKILYEKFGD